MGRRYVLAKKITVYLLLVILFIYGLIEAQQFLAPLALAVLLSYLLYPIANFLEKGGLARILANLISIILAVVVLVAVIHFFSDQFSVFVEDFPQMREQATINLRQAQEWVSDVFGVSNSTIRDWVEERIANLTNLDDTLKTIFKATTRTLVIIGLMPVYIFFMLYYRTKFYRFILRMAPDKEEYRAEKILNEMNKVTTKYMTGVFTVVMILAVVHSIAFTIIGLKYPILLGITAALFNFIPYFGTLIGALVPITFSMVAMDDLDYTFWVLVYFLFIQFTENNILTPNITGGHVSLNPLVTILSLIVGSMIWGVTGMFIVIPFVAMFRIFCEHFSFLKPVAFLLSDRGTEEHALSIEKIKKAFKKD
ncbi:AI-2E family transporter [Cesiribacter sp. SM1]|uniref:AI-2E family transporter n=1 Tax=Cesiribacter sp. SM1 TaxID=2861196 RepID=UPI001CD3243B|nr:AI-2E family transporter [Cesiribacter sp. SM1]